jgi:flagellar biosynthesis/type III secretory pathway protein FliH
MHRLFPILFFIAAITASAQTDSRDAHFRENGSSTIFTRSAFAHGYRHGYEEGYHLGNVDINMGRQPRTKANQFHGIARTYLPEFGPKKSFESGFQDGLRAGYADGYAGHTFRAVESFRQVSESLSQTPSPADSRNVYFDQGFSSGYGQGLEQGKKDTGPAQQADLRFVGCGDFHPSRQQDLPAQESYCEGFRRGYVLGHADAVVLRPEHGALAAKK